MRRYGWAVLLSSFSAVVSWADEPPGRFSFSLPDPNALRSSLHERLREDFEMQTLGGRQFWGDVQYFHGYHIQQNVFTGHYRLLDEHDWRHATGTLEECRQKLDQLSNEKKLPAMSGRVVILLHGIIRSSKSLHVMADQLREEGYTVFPMEYPSTQISIPDAADYLNSIIEHTDGVEELYLVGHSMGGLVIRAWFASYEDPRVKRVVMLGTPNYGAEMADHLKRNLLFRTVFGPAGRQLVTDDAGLIPTLPIPPCEFAVIAGARGKSGGWNPLIPGDDDGTVTVASARLLGASDFATVKLLHHALLGNRDVSTQVARFLKTGCLREDGVKQPVVDKEEVGSEKAE
ncbi:alpha/beta fold hydrolase [bacterium]|nr:alpha/beta fold hydrolase [bacterium]